MHYEYQTKGTCSSRILFDIEDGKLKNVEYIGGCNGNLQGIGRGHAGRRGHFPSARHPLRLQAHILSRPAGDSAGAGKGKSREGVSYIRRILS